MRLAPGPPRERCHDPRARLPLLPRPAAPHVRRSGHVPPVPATSPARAALRDGALLSAARLGLLRVLPGADRGGRAAPGDLRRRQLRILLVVRGLVAAPRGA